VLTKRNFAVLLAAYAAFIRAATGPQLFENTVLILYIDMKLRVCMYVRLRMHICIYVLIQGVPYFSIVGLMCNV
jgi:hypothetical protein